MNPTESAHARPEQQFFDDPAIDRLMGTVMALATEVFVLQARMRTLETELCASGAVDINDLNVKGEDAAQQAAEAEAYSKHLLRPLLGLQDSLSPTE
tara:strand:+ start:20095 stop:20385 length:291 start_codon:yes stop_codon:yes gene_type:complete